MRAGTRRSLYTRNAKPVETPLFPTSGNIKETVQGEQYTTNLKAMHQGGQRSLPSGKERGDWRKNEIRRCRTRKDSNHSGT
jgi:hypothetical protein